MNTNGNEKEIEKKEVITEEEKEQLDQDIAKNDEKLEQIKENAEKNKYECEIAELREKLKNKDNELVNIKKKYKELSDNEILERSKTINNGLSNNNNYHYVSKDEEADDIQKIYDIVGKGFSKYVPENKFINGMSDVNKYYNNLYNTHIMKLNEEYKEYNSAENKKILEKIGG